MLWNLLRTGWANTSAIFALALLPTVLISNGGSTPVGRDQVKIERPYLIAADQGALDLVPASN
jgi:hypothetical protein